MNVRFSRRARLDSVEIWQWNAKAYGVDHAESYAEFLEGRIQGLGDEPMSGRRVQSRPDLLQLVMRRTSSGHGHIAFYRVEGERIEVVRVLHTARNWPGLLRDEPA